MESLQVIAAYTTVDPSTVVIISVNTHVAFKAVFRTRSDDTLAVMANSIFFDHVTYLLKVNARVAYQFSRVTEHEHNLQDASGYKKNFVCQYEPFVHTTLQSKDRVYLKQHRKEGKAHEHPVEDYCLRNALFFIYCFHLKKITSKSPFLFQDLDHVRFLFEIFRNAINGLFSIFSLVRNICTSHKKVFNHFNTVFHLVSFDFIELYCVV